MTTNAVITDILTVESVEREAFHGVRVVAAAPQWKSRSEIGEITFYTPLEDAPKVGDSFTVYIEKYVPQKGTHAPNTDIT